MSSPISPARPACALSKPSWQESAILRSRKPHRDVRCHSSIETAVRHWWTTYRPQRGRALFEPGRQIAQMRRRDRYLFSAGHLEPDEPSFLNSFGKRACSLAIVPDHLLKVAWRSEHDQTTERVFSAAPPALGVPTMESLCAYP